MNVSFLLGNKIVENSRQNHRKNFSWCNSHCARRSNQSILKEISPGISLEGMMRKLKLQYFGHLTQRVDSLEKTLMLGGIGGRRRRGRLRMASLTWWTWVWVNSRSWWWTGRPGVLWSWGRKESDMTDQLNWTEWLLAVGVVESGAIL